MKASKDKKDQLVEPKKVYHPKRERPIPEIKKETRMYIPRAVINDLKSEKNGTKKAVFWVKKKKKDEDGTVKGEKYVTSQQYIGDWKNNQMHGYGVKIYDNKDKYEGYWIKGKRDGKGTYWICIGKNKFRKLYTGDWKNNQKEGQGIYFYKDGSCYDGEWKNSKRNGKGLMFYKNKDIYEGQWKDDKRDGYGVLEKVNGDKYYGYWQQDLKEGQGYYYYHSTSKIYLGEWHEDNARCGIFTDVEDKEIQEQLKLISDHKERPSDMPVLKLKNPEGVLEDSISNVHFLRNIKKVKNKNIEDLYDGKSLIEMTKMYSELKQGVKKEEDGENKIPDFEITRDDLREIINLNLSYVLTKETLELIFYALELPLFEETKIDFLLFVKIYFLIQQKLQNEQMDKEEEEMLNEEMEENNRYDEEAGIEEGEEGGNGYDEDDLLPEEREEYERLNKASKAEKNIMKEPEEDEGELEEGEAEAEGELEEEGEAEAEGEVSQSGA
ncbi:MAG: hypothetical protein MJ252_16615 [archaeon]|nr:hypothetical protein [archaeon]